MGDESASDDLTCLRCDEPLSFVGEKNFHEGSRGWAFFFGDFGELLTDRETIQMFACESCGHVEFFLPA